MTAQEPRTPQPSEQPARTVACRLDAESAYCFVHRADPVCPIGERARIEAKAAAPDPVASHVDDPEVLALWQDYRHVTKTGNPLGMSFAHYVAARVGEPPPITSTSTTLQLNPVASPAPLDFEEMRRNKGWPTPNHMRSAADGLDLIAIPKYGDILRWMADACDGALEGQPVAKEPA